MQRTQLVAYRSTLVAPDVAESLRLLELRSVEAGGVRLRFEGVAAPKLAWPHTDADPGPTGCPARVSLRPAGRELRLRVLFQKPPERLRESEVRQKEVEVMWGLAVPLGFTPWNRYPIAGPNDDVFHVLGPWQGLYDSLCGEGRGEVAWPSMCCAAQVDAGRWEGDRPVERFVQAQLHRLGVPCGAVDGVIGERTRQGLQALGFGSALLADAAVALSKMDPPELTKEARRVGHLIVPGRVTALAHGRVAVMRTVQGYALTIDGPGRLVVDLG